MQFVPKFKSKKGIADAKNVNLSQSVTLYGMTGNSAHNHVRLMENVGHNWELQKVVNQVTPFVPKFKLK